MSHCDNFNAGAGSMGIRSFGNGAEAVEIDQCGGSPLEISNGLNIGLTPETPGLN